MLGDPLFPPQFGTTLVKSRRRAQSAKSGLPRRSCRQARAHGGADGRRLIANLRHKQGSLMGGRRQAGQDKLDKPRQTFHSTFRCQATSSRHHPSPNKIPYMANAIAIWRFVLNTQTPQNLYGAGAWRRTSSFQAGPAHRKPAWSLYVGG